MADDCGDTTFALIVAPANPWPPSRRAPSDRTVYSAEPSLTACHPDGTCACATPARAVAVKPIAIASVLAVFVTCLMNCIRPCSSGDMPIRRRIERKGFTIECEESVNSRCAARCLTNHRRRELPAYRACPALRHSPLAGWHP